MSRIDMNHSMRYTFAVLAVALGAIFAATTAEARSITGVERIVSSDKMFLNVTFEAGETGDNHALYIAYDTEDKGADISSWAALQRGCNVAAEATSATIPVSPLLTEKGYTFCRVFLTTSAAPYDTLIEFLRQTGTQYIDTGIKPDPTTIASLDFQFSDASTKQQRVFGVSSDGGKDYATFSFDAYINGSGDWASACQDGGGDFLGSSQKASTDRLTITLDATTGDHTVSNHVSGVVTPTTRSTTRTATSAGTMPIFAHHKYYYESKKVKNNFRNIAKGGLIYGGTITTNGAPARIYHPCALGGRAGLYDAVSGQISYSAVAPDFVTSDPVACSLLTGETQIAAAPAATGLFFDYTWRGTAENWGGTDAWTKEGDPATWVEGNNAIFATANSAATLAADVSANSITFSADATVAGTGTSELNVKSVLVNLGVSAAISAPISSAFEKTGAGTLTLAQDRTAATIVKEGTLKMDGATIADLTLGTDGGAPVTFDYSGQELVKNTRDYLVTGSTVTLTNGTFSTPSSDDLNIRDDTFTMPSVLTIAKDAVVRQGAIGKSVYIVNVNGTATINVIGGTLGNTDGCDLAYLQHKSPDGGLNLNVSEGGLVYFPCQVYALCRGDIATTSPSLYMTFANSAFSVGTKFEFGSSWGKDSNVPTAPTGVFAATNSVVSVGDGFIVGRNKRDSKMAGSLTVDFENCVVTAKMFAVYYDRPLNNARFNGTQFVFGAESGSFAASDDAANWITVGDDGLTLDTQAYSATLNANLGGSGAVTKVGAGTLTVSRNQATTGGFNVSAGTLAPNPGLTFEGPVSVADSSMLVINASDTTKVSELSFAAGAKLNIANYDGTLPVNAGTLSLPATGSVKLMLNGGAFGEGVYAIYSATGVTAADGDKFSFDLAIADLIPTWSVVDGVLVLTVRATAQTWNGAAGESVSWASGWTGGAWVETHDAIFNTAGAIASVDADVSANAVKFNESATVNGSATLTPHVVFVAEGKEATINAPAAGALEKIGLGALTLTQNRADATTVTAGTLKMDGATVAGLTLGTDGGAPVTFDYGGQELVKNAHGLDYLVTGSTVMLTNGIFSTASGFDLNIRDDTFTMPSVLTIAKDAVVRQGDPGKSIYINNVSVEARTINVIGGALEKPSGTGNAYIQHKSVSGRVNINVTDGGHMSFPDVVYALCRGDIVVSTPSLYMTFCDSTFNVGGTFNFGTSYTSDKYVPTNPTGVFAATNSVISIGGAFNIGRNKQDEKTDGSLTADFENCTVTAKTFAVYYDRPLNNARFNNTRFVFNADSGSIAASDDAANWITVGDDGLTLDTQAYSATLNANLGGSGTVTKVGTGTLTVSRDQATTGGICVNEGTLAIDGSVTFAESVEFAAGSTLDIVGYNGTTAMRARVLTLPTEGAISLTLDGGSFDKGVYAICAAPGVSKAAGEKFSFTTADDLVGKWSVDGDTLLLSVGEIDPNMWTARGGDGKMSNGANWGGGNVPSEGSDVDFSGVLLDTTIIADTGRTFGAVTMGNGVITFTGALKAASFSDTSKVAVAADSTVTLEGDLVIDTTSGNKYIVNSVADGGKFKVTGKIRAIGTNSLWPSMVTCNGAIEASGLVSAVSGSDLWTFRLSNSAGHIGKWIIGEDGLACDGAYGFWVHNNANARTEIQAAADFTIQDAWIGLSTKATTFTIQTTSPDGIARTITAKTGFAAHADGACNLDVRGSGTFLCDYTVQAFGNGGPKAFSGAITVKDTATLAVNSEKYPTTGAISVSNESTFKVAQSGVVTLSGNLSLADGAALGFNFTNRKVGPLLALASGKSLSFVGEGVKNIAVKVSGDVWPVGGKHILTATGGFNGVSVSLAEGAPKWAKSVYVNTDGNIVLDVKPMGTKVIVR